MSSRNKRRVQDKNVTEIRDSEDLIEIDQVVRDMRPRTDSMETHVSGHDVTDTEAISKPKNSPKVISI